MSTSDTMFLLGSALAPIMILRNVHMLRSPHALRRYVETSPKCRRMRDRLGVDATIELTRKRYLPVGTAMWTVIGALSIYIVVKQWTV